MENSNQNKVVKEARVPVLTSIISWFDTHSRYSNVENIDDDESIDWVRASVFIAFHFVCLAVLWVGWSWIAVATAVFMYVLRMFAITGFYHRYFSHRTFKTSRACQFIFAILGNSATQRGPLWWAAHHRHHHLHSDKEEDVHSPIQKGFLRSHMGWFLSKAHFPTNLAGIKDFAKFPELLFINRFDTLVPVLLGMFMYAFGALLNYFAPSLGTSGWQMLVWGFFISTTVLFHGTFVINSLAHQFGKRRYKTDDTSRNSFILALITLGEGWHNNHHHYPASTRQGFFWWEIDITYYILVTLSWMHIIWDIQPVPLKRLEAHRL